MSQRNWKTSQRRKARHFKIPTTHRKKNLQVINEASSDSSLNRPSNDESQRNGSSPEKIDRLNNDDVVSSPGSQTNSVPSIFKVIEADAEKNLKNDTFHRHNVSESKFPLPHDEDLFKIAMKDNAQPSPISNNEQHVDDENNETFDYDEEGPIIYAEHDDDSISQITSSIACNSVYSFENLQYFDQNHDSGFERSSHHEGILNPNIDNIGLGIKTDFKGKNNNCVLSKGEITIHNSNIDPFFANVASASKPPPTEAFIHESKVLTDKIENGEDNDHLININIYSQASTSSRSETTQTEKNDDITMIDMYSQSQTPSAFTSTTNITRNNRDKMAQNCSPDASNISLGFILNKANSAYLKTRITVNHLVNKYINFSSPNSKKDDDHSYKPNQELGSESSTDKDYFAILMSPEYMSPTLKFNSNNSSNGKKLRIIQVIFRLFCVILIMFMLNYLATIGNDAVKSGPLNNKSRYENFPIALDSESKNIRGKANFNTVVLSHTDDIEPPIRGNPKKDEINNMNIVLPPIFDFVSDVDEELDLEKETPFFWHVPRSAGATMNEILGFCFGLKLASNSEGLLGHENDKSLRLVMVDGHFLYVNVDLSNTIGIQHAKEIGLASSGLADVAVSSLLHQTVSIFSTSKKCRMFTILRHPVERAVSLFYFLQDTVWKSEGSLNGDLANIEIDTYFKSGIAESNWQVRYLINQPTKGELDEDDLALAKEILRRKFLVGLLNEKGESLSRFQRYFGWELKNGSDKDCLEKNMQWSWPFKHKHKQVQEGSGLWDQISHHNRYDMKLFEYAQVLFREQNIYFS